MNDDTRVELVRFAAFLREHSDEMVRVYAWNADDIDAALTHIDALRAEVEKRRSTEQERVDAVCHYRNLAIGLGAKPETMLNDFDRKLAVDGVNLTERTPGYWSMVDSIEELAEQWRDVDVAVAAARKEFALSGCFYGGMGCAAEAPLDEPCEGCAARRAAVAAAREETREACAREVEDGETCRCDMLDSDAQCGYCIGKASATAVRATPLDSTPLADRIAELERRMAVVLHAGPSTSLAVSVFDRAEKAEAERDALRAQVERVRKVAINTMALGDDDIRPQDVLDALEGK